MSNLRLPPLLIFIWGFYYVVSYFSSDAVWEAPFRFAVPLPSGERMLLTNSYVIICFSLVLLLIDIIRSTKASDSVIFKQLLSLVVFIFFASLPFGFATFSPEPTYLVLLAVNFVEVASTFVILPMVARRDISVGAGLP